jgi:FkbM family methyltransferase
MTSFKNGGGQKVMFDIGANIGEYSEMIKAKSNGLDVNLHLFEPTKSCFETISVKFKNDNNINLNNFGASNEDGEATIY